VARRHGSAPLEESILSLTAAASPFGEEKTVFRGSVFRSGIERTHSKVTTKIELDYKIGDHVVYPAHGVGVVIGVETQSIAGSPLEVYVITFDHEKMTLRVPTKKARTAGLRALAEGNVVNQALTTLKGRARIKRTMWSRRAQEYEAKINSGDLISIAEVVRDLHRSESQPEQSYSERQLYESALDRMAREVAAIERIDRDAAISLLHKSLQKAA
jgi:CarD family transcriptional regulator